jgi:hypothetical protein
VSASPNPNRPSSVDSKTPSLVSDDTSNPKLPKVSNTCAQLPGLCKVSAAIARPVLRIFNAGNLPPTLSFHNQSAAIITSGDQYTIIYSLVDPEDSAYVDLFYDTDNKGFDGVPIKECIFLPHGNLRSCSWPTGGVKPNKYFIYGIAFDGEYTINSYSSTPVTIVGDTKPNCSDSIKSECNTALFLSYPDKPVTIMASDPITITYTVATMPQHEKDLSGVSLFYDTDSDGLNGTFIPGCSQLPRQANGSCTWNTQGILPGQYHVYGTMYDYSKSSIPLKAIASGLITINEDVRPSCSASLSQQCRPYLAFNQPNGNVSLKRGEYSTVTYTMYSGVNQNAMATFSLVDKDQKKVVLVGCSRLRQGENLTCQYDTAPFSPGDYGLTGRVDGYPSVVSSARITITQDSVAPRLTIHTPSGNEQLNTAQQFTHVIHYSLLDYDSEPRHVVVDFYYDTDNSGFDGHLAQCRYREPYTPLVGADQTCIWTASLPPATYSIYGIANDGDNPPVKAYAPGTLTILQDAKLVSGDVAPSEFTIHEPATPQIGVNAEQGYEISYTLQDQDADVVASFVYYNIKTGEYRPISGCLSKPEGQSVTCLWDTSQLKSGEYFVLGEAGNENKRIRQYAPGSVMVVHKDDASQQPWYCHFIHFPFCPSADTKNS